VENITDTRQGTYGSGDSEGSRKKKVKTARLCKEKDDKWKKKIVEYDPSKNVFSDSDTSEEKKRKTRKLSKGSDDSFEKEELGNAFEKEELGNAISLRERSDGSSEGSGIQTGRLREYEIKQTSAKTILQTESLNDGMKTDRALEIILQNKKLNEEDEDDMLDEGIYQPEPGTLHGKNELMVLGAVGQKRSSYKMAIEGSDEEKWIDSNKVRARMAGNSSEEYDDEDELNDSDDDVPRKPKRAVQFGPGGVIIRPTESSDRVVNLELRLATAPPLPFLDNARLPSAPVPDYVPQSSVAPPLYVPFDLLSKLSVDNRPLSPLESPLSEGLCSISPGESPTDRSPGRSLTPIRELSFESRQLDSLPHVPFPPVTWDEGRTLDARLAQEPATSPPAVRISLNTLIMPKPIITNQMSTESDDLKDADQKTPVPPVDDQLPAPPPIRYPSSIILHPEGNVARPSFDKYSKDPAGILSGYSSPTKIEAGFVIIGLARGELQPMNEIAVDTFEGVTATYISDGEYSPLGGTVRSEDSSDDDD